MNIDTSQLNQEGRRLLQRSANGRIFGGVAAGIADYFGLNLAHVRVALVALSFIGGAGVPLYLAAWALVPLEGSDVTIADGILSHIAGPAS
jgi:phage shock protein C